jgi:hypothetical protein
MTQHETVGKLTFEALGRAVELRDPQMMLGFYAEDAEVRVLNGDAPQSPPFEVRGKAEISRYLRAIFNQDMTCQIESGVVSSEKRITFSEVCEYPDGTRVVVETALEINSEGEITEQVDVVTQNAQEGAGEGGRRYPRRARGGTGSRLESIDQS